MGETDVETMGNVTVAKYDFDDEAFNDISEDALNFVSQLLVKEPEKRMTASECLQHPWLARRQSSPRPPLTTELITVFSPPPETPPPPPGVDNEQDSASTLSDYGVESTPLKVDEDGEEPPPPLPKTAPPPIELLIESSLPIAQRPE